MRRTAEDAARTRDGLIAAGVRYFAVVPYSDARLKDVAEHVGVSRGAIYHHFDTKERFFSAVVERVFLDVRDQIVRAADAAKDPWDAIRAGCDVFLQAATDPTFRRIALLDGPAVLGWEGWRAIDERTTAGTLADGLSELRTEGRLATEDVDALTIGLSGAMNELSLWIAAQSDGGAALNRATAVVRRMLDAYRVRG